MTRRVLVTGGTGLVGSHVVRALAGGGHEVGVLMRASSDPWRIADVLPRVSAVGGDLAQPDSVDEAAARFAPDTVIHLAWEGVAGRCRNDRGQFRNIAATASLAEACGRAGARHLVGLGSQAEYGIADRVVDEERPAAPVTLYGIAKASACLAARHLCGRYGMRFAWLRLFSTYGPADDPAWLIPYVILTLMRGERPALTEGTQRWDYLYVADVAEAICAVAVGSDAEGAFNLGSGEAYVVRGIAEKIRDLIDPDLPLGLGEVPFRPDQVMWLQADIGRLRRATGWEPRVGLDEGLRRTVEWFQEHRDRYGA